MDRRINKTKQIMKEALTTLLEQKDIRKITVKELSQLANINRGTFYLHYMDIYDMVDQLGNEIINEISAIIEKNNALHMGAFYIPILVKIVEYLNQDMRFCKVLIGPNGDLGFLEKLKKTMMNQTYRTYKNVQLNHDQTFLRFLTCFLVSGGIGAFQEWINEGCLTPLPDVIAPCEMVIANGMNNL